MLTRAFAPAHGETFRDAETRCGSTNAVRPESVVTLAATTEMDIADCR